jgi:L-threonylcarbamoyladenylate synthase
MREPSSPADVAHVILSGGVIAFRTDTFYGLGADPQNGIAIRKIFALKGREEGQPILLLISDRNCVERFISNPSTVFNQLADRLWPGPLTLIGRARAEVLPELTAGTGTIGLRLPDDTRVRELVRACGGALTATSANPSARSPARSAYEVREYFGDRIDLIVDAGEADVVSASTVVDASDEHFRIVREGLIGREQIESVTR